MLAGRVGVNWQLVYQAPAASAAAADGGGAVTMMMSRAAVHPSVQLHCPVRDGEWVHIDLVSTPAAATAAAAALINWRRNDDEATRPVCVRVCMLYLPVDRYSL